LGRVGIGTPQANPTVEAEMAILLPRACSLHITRLTSGEESPEARLRAYLLDLETHLGAYDTLHPDVFGFACTGSSYLLGRAEEERLIDRAATRFGYPVETACRAIAWSLARMRARRIALVAPYSASLIDAATEYWMAAGIEVVGAHQIPTGTADTRGIYELSNAHVDAVLRAVPCDGLDAVLVSGTGLPSLPALRRRDLGVPVIASNLCLAARLLEMLGLGAWLDGGTPYIRGWERRLDEALAGG
jgi:maleate isomerase